MKTILFAFLLFPFCMNGQFIYLNYPNPGEDSVMEIRIEESEGDTTSVPEVVSKNSETNQFKFFKNSYIDLLFNGGMQASAKVLQLNIGDTSKFYVPLLIYAGAVGAGFSDQENNEIAHSTLVNQLGAY